MSNKVIIFKNVDASIGVIYPTPEGLKALGSIEALAVKDVPNGCRWGIFDKSDISSDRTFREAWSIDDSALNDPFTALSDSELAQAASDSVLEA